MSNQATYINLFQIWNEYFAQKEASLINTLKAMESEVSEQLRNEPERSSELCNTIKIIKTAQRYQDDTTGELLDSIFMLGFNISNSLKHYEFESEEDLIRKSVTHEFESTRNTSIENACSKRLRKRAITLAEELWQLPETQHYRTGDMAYHVHEILVNELEDKLKESDNDDTTSEIKKLRSKLPKSPEGIKSWLTKVAPEHAKKAGPNHQRQQSSKK